MRDLILVFVTVMSVIGISAVLFVGGALVWMLKEIEDEHRQGGRR